MIIRKQEEYNKEPIICFSRVNVYGKVVSEALQGQNYFNKTAASLRGI